MPRIVNLGSLNLDLLYRVRHIVRPGETLGSESLLRGAGGKGLNQSLAAARAGGNVVHIGRVGADGQELRRLLAVEGVDVSNIATTETPTGHAIIQVANDGENSIVLFPGANHALTRGEIEAALAGFGAGDWFLTQNETSCVGDALTLAARRGMRVVFNPAPMSAAVFDLPLGDVGLWILNETEAASLAGVESAEAAMGRLRQRFRSADIVLTLGAEGAWWAGPAGECRIAPPRVQAVDTTAAGDTFIGYLVASLAGGMAMSAALRLACRAAALSTTQLGAAASIPRPDEVAAFQFFARRHA